MAYTVLRVFLPGLPPLFELPSHLFVFAIGDVFAAGLLIALFVIGEISWPN